MKHGIETFAVGMALAAALALTAGTSWEVAEDCGDTVNLFGVAFATPEKGVAFGEGYPNVLMFSVDGGANWKAARTEFLEDKVWAIVADAVFSDRITGWATGYYSNDKNGGFPRIGFLLKTQDSGATWENQPLPNTVAQIGGWRLWFDKAGNGWMLPYNGHVIFRTTDGGKSWDQLNFRAAYPTVQDNPGWIHMGWHVFDSEHLMVCGGAGILLETKDGGRVWTAMDTGLADLNTEGLMSIFFINEKKGWAVGEKGVIVHTKDGGKTWEQQKSGVPNPLERVQFVDKKTGYASGWAIYQGSATARYPGVLLFTDNGGKTWKNINPTSSTLRGLFVLDAKHAWAVGGKGGSGSEPKVMILRYAKER